jgi:predicted RNA binding protein YcfA (HicA-like mRNA interferase family)
VPKLGLFSGDEVCRILESHGFHRVRQKGSHAKMQKQTSDSTITIPVNHSSTSRAGFACSLHQERLSLKPQGTGRSFKLTDARMAVSSALLTGSCSKKAPA